MPQGCDFTCRNKGCRGFEKTIVMHGVWPTKGIDEALAEAGASAANCCGDVTRKNEPGRIKTAWRIPAQDLKFHPDRRFHG